MKILFLNGSEKELEALKKANLESADLRSADLEGANLESADLRSADLEGADVTTFQFNRHFAFYHEGNAQIGCIWKLLDWWLSNFKEVGEREGYTEKETVAYGSFIKLCVTLNK